MRKPLLFIAVVSMIAGGGRAAVQPDPAVTSAPKDDVTITFDKQGRHDVPITILDGTVIFQAEIAGKTVWMLLDNGAAHSVIDTELAKSSGLRIDAPNGVMVLPSGSVPSVKVHGVTVVVPGQFATTVPMRSYDLLPASTRLGYPIKAVLGHDFLSMMAVAITPASGRMFFLPGGGLTLHPHPGASPFTIIPVQSVNGQDKVGVKIGDNDLSLSIDLGSGSQISLTSAAWAKIKPANAQMTAHETMDVSGHEIKSLASNLPSVAIGTLSVHDVQVNIEALPPANGDGTIGFGLLSRFNVALDLQGQKLFLVSPSK